MNKKFIVILASAALLTACQKDEKEEISSQYKTIELYATIEQPGSTGSKTVFGDTDNKTFQNLKWDGKEEILVIDEKNKFAKMVYDSSPDGKITAKFINMDPLPDGFGSIQYAFYPYESFVVDNSPQLDVNGGTITLNISQTSPKNLDNILPGANPSCAKVEGRSSAEFKNICGMLKFPITEEGGSGWTTYENIISFDIKLDQQISGSFTYHYDTNKIDQATSPTDSQTKISMAINMPPAGNFDNIYFIVPPAEYEKIIITATDGLNYEKSNVTAKFDEKFSVEPSHIYPFPTLFWVGDTWNGFKLSPY